MLGGAWRSFSGSGGCVGTCISGDVSKIRDAIASFVEGLSELLLEVRCGSGVISGGFHALHWKMFRCLGFGCGVHALRGFRRRCI